MHWDTIARKYVEHDTLPQETFAPLEQVLRENEYMPDIVRQEDPVLAAQMAMGIGIPSGTTQIIIDPLQRNIANDNAPKKDRGPYIAVYRGRFYPFDPRASEVDIETIAHQLAAIVRYGGGTEKPYSVAEHSVHIARWLQPRYGDRTALYGLLHDAPEALSGFGDVQRPSKDRVPQIRAIEEKIWHAVAAAFGLSPMIPIEVHDADNRIIADEMAQGMWEGDPLYRNPLGVELQFWDPGRAEIYFMDTFRKLVRGEELRRVG